MEIKLHKWENPKWVVVADDGTVNLITMSYKRTDCIKKWCDLWDTENKNSKWRLWKRRGYRCVKVEISVKLLLTESAKKEIGL